MNKVKRYIKEKEMEHLRWDCLMKSKPFLEFWVWIKATLNDPTTPIPEKFKPTIDAQGMKITPRILFVFKKYLTYIAPRTIESASFDEYWAKRETWLNSDKYRNSRTPQPIVDYADEILNDIDSIVAYFQRHMNCDPTINELKEDLNQQLNARKERSTYLQITQWEFTNEENNEIVKEIKRILSKKIPSKRLRLDEARRYLNVYDLRTKNKLTYPMIHKKINPKLEYDEARRLALYSDFKKAKKMIENAENGLPLW